MKTLEINNRLTILLIVFMVMYSYVVILLVCNLQPVKPPVSPYDLSSICSPTCVQRCQQVLEGQGTQRILEIGTTGGGIVKDERAMGQTKKTASEKYCEAKPYNELEVWNNRKKVISYAVFLPADATELPEWIWTGLVLNIETAALYYPEWIIRVYSYDLPDALVDKITKISIPRVEVVRCHADSLLPQLNPARKMISRFLAIDDPAVETVLVRDVDSRFSVRELLAVNEWLSSGMNFHTMRDHIWHSVPVMGGMFGMKRGLFNQGQGMASSMTSLVDQMLREYPSTKIPGCCQDDQNFLEKYVWPAVKHTTMDHDYRKGRGKSYGSNLPRPYPIGPRGQAENFFVGAIFKDESANATYSCSVHCLMKNPTEHPSEW